MRRGWTRGGSEEADAVVYRGRRNVLHTATERRLPATVADSLRMSVLGGRDSSVEANQRCSSPMENANTYVKAPENDELWRLETGPTADQDGLRTGVISDMV